METNVKAVELKELWRRYKEDGDKRAREQLVLAFSPLVKLSFPPVNQPSAKESRPKAWNADAPASVPTVPLS